LSIRSTIRQDGKCDVCRNDVGKIRPGGQLFGARRPPLLIKKERARREMEAGIVDPQYDQAGGGGDATCVYTT